jgi:hypothetical protein
VFTELTNELLDLRASTLRTADSAFALAFDCCSWSCRTWWPRQWRIWGKNRRANMS